MKPKSDLDNMKPSIRLEKKLPFKQEAIKKLIGRCFYEWGFRPNLNQDLLFWVMPVRIFIMYESDCESSLQRKVHSGLFIC